MNATPALSADARLLCLALDGGDDSALLALADELEECGDPRAAGLRTAARDGRCPLASPSPCARPWWWYSDAYCDPHGRAAVRPDMLGDQALRHMVRADVLGRMWDARHGDDSPGEAGMSYLLRSDAYLALAEA